MKLLILPIILQLIGVAVIFAEIFIPSLGLLATIAAGLFGYSLYLVFTSVSTTIGLTFLAADIIMLPFVIYLGLKMLSRSPATLHETLSSQEGVVAQNPVLESFMGQEGESLADLRPSGPALLDGQRVDVVTRGEYVGKGSKIKVVSVKGNQVVVRAVLDE